MAGVPLLRGILPANARVIVEIAFAANLAADASNWELANQWIDVTTDVIQDQPITISPMGRSDRFTQAQPASCTLRLNNSSGAYSRGPASSNWPYVRPNTPLRVSVTLNGITLYRRFFGYIESWEPHDDDASAKSPWVAVTAWGRMHGLDLKDSPVVNMLSRYHVVNGASAVWPFDDGGAAVVAANAVPGGPPMTPGAVGAVFGIDVSTTLPAAGTAATLGVPGPNFDVMTSPVNIALSGLLHLDMWRKQAAEPDGSETQLISLELNDSGAWTPIEVRARASQISPLIKAGYIVKVAGSTVLDSANGSPGSTMDPFNSAFHNVHVVFQQISANVQATLYVDGVNVDSHTFTSATLPSVLKTVHLRNSVVAGSGTGNFDVQSVIAVNTTAAGAPSWTVGSVRYLGELATDRLTRLCAEEGLGTPLVLTGTSNMAMGIQKSGKLVDLLRECESADQGVLYDGVSQGLAYISRAAKYNQAATLTLDASAGQVAPPFEPKDQDPQRRNYWVIGRRDGSSAVATDTTGPLGTDAIGFLRQSVSDLNLSSDTPLPHIAGWLLRLGTVNEPYYYPTLHLDLSAIPSLAANWLATAIGNRIDVPNLSTVSARNPPGVVSVILEGYTEIISPDMWTVTANCSQASPWQVAATGSTFRLEMAGQTLAAPLAAGATSLNLATAPNHQPFTANGADFPVDLYVNGWPVHVTACGNTLTDTASRTVSNGLGTADSGQSYTANGGNASDYSVGSGVISLSLGSVGASRKGLLPALPSGDFEAFATVVCPVTASGGNISVGIIGHEFSATDYYMLGVQFTTAGTLLAWWTRVGGAGGGIVTQNAATGLSYSPGTSVNIHIKYSGSTHTANVWTTGPEPNGWQLTVTATDATLDPVKAIGIRAILETGNTNTLPVVVTFDNISIPNPQVLTCSAAPNVSTVPAGTAVTLWRPAALAL
jgi:hypothetical protein